LANKYFQTKNYGYDLKGQGCYFSDEQKHQLSLIYLKKATFLL